MVDLGLLGIEELVNVQNTAFAQAGVDPAPLFIKA
jgi:hypothetical protein